MNSSYEQGRESLSPRDDWGRGSNYGEAQRGSGFEQVRHTVAEKLHEAAETLRQKTATTQSSNVRDFSGQASDWLDRSAQYVDEFDTQRFKDDVSNEVRRNPGRSLLIAGAAGLLLGAILRRR